MKEVRRRFLQLTGGAGALAAVAATGLFKAGPVAAASWNKAAFEAKTMEDVMKILGVSDPVTSSDISITAPDIAENGAIVPVAVTSRIPNTESIAIISEKNPFPLAASFNVMGGIEGYVSTRIKMGQTSNVRAVVKAGGKYYTAVKEVKVTVGGCG